MNSRRAHLVEPLTMIRNAVLALLGMLLLATPAAAAGEKSSTPLFVPGPNASTVARTTTPVMPASSPFVVATKPFTASTAVGNPLSTFVPAPAVPDHRQRRHHHRPIFVAAPAPQYIVVQQPVYYAQTFVAVPAECATPGYWAYRWVPYTTTETVWVQGSWGTDGAWIDSHWESRPYSSGYYEPFWTPGDSSAC